MKITLQNSKQNISRNITLLVQSMQKINETEDK